MLEIALVQHAWARRTWWCLSSLVQQESPPPLQVRLHIHRDDPFSEINERLIETFAPRLTLQVVVWTTDEFFHRGCVRNRDIGDCGAEWLLFVDPDTVFSTGFLAALNRSRRATERVNFAPRTTMTDFDVGYELVDSVHYDSEPIDQAAARCARVTCLRRDRWSGAGYFHLVHPESVRKKRAGYGRGCEDRRFDHEAGLRTPTDRMFRLGMGVHRLRGLPPFYHLQHWRRWQDGCPEHVRNACH